MLYFLAVMALSIETATLLWRLATRDSGVVLFCNKNRPTVWVAATLSCATLPGAGTFSALLPARWVSSSFLFFRVLHGFVH